MFRKNHIAAQRAGIYLAGSRNPADAIPAKRRGGFRRRSCLCCATRPQPDTAQVYLCYYRQHAHPHRRGQTHLARRRIPAGRPWTHCTRPRGGHCRRRQRRLVDALDAVVMVRFIADTTPGVGALFPRNPGSQLAQRLGIRNATVFQGTIGGNTPQYLVNHFAGELARGDVRRRAAGRRGNAGNAVHGAALRRRISRPGRRGPDRTADRRAGARGAYRDGTGARAVRADQHLPAVREQPAPPPRRQPRTAHGAHRGIVQRA